jgi:hypothetical protein
MPTLTPLPAPAGDGAATAWVFEDISIEKHKYTAYRRGSVYANSQFLW